MTIKTQKKNGDAKQVT